MRARRSSIFRFCGSNNRVSVWPGRTRRGSYNFDSAVMAAWAVGRSQPFRIMTDIRVSPWAIFTFRTIIVGGAVSTDILVKGSAKKFVGGSAAGRKRLGCCGKFWANSDGSGWFATMAMATAEPDNMANIITARIRHLDDDLLNRATRCRKSPKQRN